MRTQIRETSEIPPDELADQTWILGHESASIVEIDRILGPRDALCSSRIASIIWKATLDMGAHARSIGAFASAYHEYLTPEEKVAADQFRL